MWIDGHPTAPSISSSGHNGFASVVVGYATDATQEIEEQRQGVVRCDAMMS
jgi:hypothetical protein